MPFKPPVHRSAQRQADQAAYRRAHDRHRGSPSARGYGRGWQQLRKMVLERDGYTCRRCGCRVSDGDGSAHVDHIVAKSKGGTDAMENLETLCLADHSRKTASEDGGFGNQMACQSPRGRDFL